MPINPNLMSPIFSWYLDPLSRLSRQKYWRFYAFKWWGKNACKGRIFSEKYWYYFHCPKNVLCSILSFVFWIFPPLDTAVQLASADSKQKAISKSFFQDSFRHIFWAMRKMHNTFWKKATFNKSERKKHTWQRQSHQKIRQGFHFPRMSNNTSAHSFFPD